MPRLPRAGSLAVLYFPATLLLVAFGLLAGGTIINAGGLVTLTVRPVRTVSPQPNPVHSTASGTSTPTTPTRTATVSGHPTPPPKSPPTSPPTSPPASGRSPHQPQQPQPQQPKPQQPQQQPQQQPPGGQQGPTGRVMTPAALHGTPGLPSGLPSGLPGPRSAQGTTLQANSPAILTAWVGLCSQTIGLTTALIGLSVGLRRAAGPGRGEPQPAGSRPTRPVRGTGNPRTPKGRRPRRQ
ncbi:hypothetical protein AB0H07_24630 [Streptomyces sp. NPDC021354]|uniref:hypothetical protein n=1 Tax=Streptomyces sp. NPDC021354 TaxID=3154793 RepID=UPI0033CF8AB3